MPFQSQAQRRFMYARHPDIARRWEALTPKGSPLPAKEKAFGQKHPADPESESHETWKPGVKRLPRKPGLERDFGMLRPSGKARHRYSKPASEQDAEAEAPVRAHVNARGPMSNKPRPPSKLEARDLAATRFKRRRKQRG